MRAIVYHHETSQGLGHLEPAFKAAGFALVKRFRGVEYRDDVGAELLVVLGGEMSVNDTAEHPFLKDELAVIAERLVADRPTLGLCLGAQLMAVAAGSEVLVGKNGRELGVAPVRWTVDALADPVVRGTSPKTVVAHWHRETWKPVAGATLLASTDRYSQQAFRLGRSYAFQFHPELGGDEWVRWLDLQAAELSAEGADVKALRAQRGKLDGAQHERTALLERLVHSFRSET